MKSSLRILLFLLFVPALCMSGALFASDKRPILGFTELSASGIDAYDATIVSQQLRKLIDSIGVYKTLEFSDIQLRLASQNIVAQVKDVNAAIIAGQILGTDFFGIGSIDQIGKKTYAISMQIIEVRSGRSIINTAEFYKGNFKNFQKIMVPLFAQKICGINIEEKPSRKK